MDSSRRSFFEELVAGGALASLLAEQAQGQAPASASAHGEIRTYDFWGKFYDNAGKGARNHLPAAEAKDIRFLYYDETKKTLRYSDQLGPMDLLDHAGDVTVDVTLGQFRPGVDDARSIKSYESSQLRIDCVQTQPFLNLLAPATWIAMAALYTNNAGKLPSLQTLGFQQPNLMSGQNKVVLPGGAGKFSVNVSSMAKESVLHKILRNGVKIGGAVSPLMGFPAMSIPAAAAFTAIYSLLEERASFIMSSPLTDAVATQKAYADASRPPVYLPLKSGDYVIVPRVHTDKLSARLKQLQVNQGYLIDSSLSTNDPIDKRADNSVPDVTYLSLRMAVTPINLAIPQAGETSGSSSSSSSSSSKKSK